MAEYNKPWLTIERQLDKLECRGIDIGSRESAAALLAQIGYYRLTGYLYPFRQSETYFDEGRDRVRVLASYRPGTSITYAAELVAYDRQLRMLVLEGVDRIEVSLRMQIGYTLGERSAFAYLDPMVFVPAFTEPRVDRDSGEVLPSKLTEWLQRVQERQDGSDEAFVAHFRERYDGKLPIWALTEILEMGHLGRLFGGLQNNLATKIAAAYEAPSKKMLGSWISSVNYIRNVSAHHARLFNRKLVAAPARPAAGQVPLLDHLRSDGGAKADFGVYNALAIMAYLLTAIDPDCDWSECIGTHLEGFPAGGLTTADMGAPADWSTMKLWAKRPATSQRL